MDDSCPDGLTDEGIMLACRSSRCLILGVFLEPRNLLHGVGTAIAERGEPDYRRMGIFRIVHGDDCRTLAVLCLSFSSTQ